MHVQHEARWQARLPRLDRMHLDAFAAAEPSGEVRLQTIHGDAAHLRVGYPGGLDRILDGR
jgi:hypothetical protein